MIFKGTKHFVFQRSKIRQSKCPYTQKGYNFILHLYQKTYFDRISRNINNSEETIIL